MPSSLRCTVCGINWRPIKANALCPQCGEETWATAFAKPIPDDEALELGGPLAVGKDPQGYRENLTNEEEIQIAEFAHWLDTVTAEDFRHSIRYPPDHPYADK